MDLVTHVPSHYPALLIALQLLIFCVAPRIDHLLRMIPPSVSTQYAEDVDHLFMETLNRLLDFELDIARVAQMQRRLKRGGLGIRKRGGSFTSIAYVASWT